MVNNIVPNFQTCLMLCKAMKIFDIRKEVQKYLLHLEESHHYYPDLYDGLLEATEKSNDIFAYFDLVNHGEKKGYYISEKRIQTLLIFLQKNFQFSEIRYYCEQYLRKFAQPSGSTLLKLYELLRNKPEHWGISYFLSLIFQIF